LIFFQNKKPSMGKVVNGQLTQWARNAHNGRKKERKLQTDEKEKKKQATRGGYDLPYRFVEEGDIDHEQQTKRERQSIKKKGGG